MNEKKTEKTPLIIERILNVSVERAWKAITDKDSLKQWLFDVPLFKAETGFKFSFIDGKEGTSYLHLCEITEVIPLKKLVFSWRYEGFSGNSFVTIELFSEEKNTRLRLTHEGLETLPVSKPGFLNGSYIPDWNEKIRSLELLVSEN